MSGRQRSSLGDAVDVDFIANTRQFFEASDGSYVNLKDILLCMSDFSNELSEPPASSRIESFFEKNG